MDSLIQKKLLKAFPTDSMALLDKLYKSSKVIYCPAKECITGPNDEDTSMYVCLSGVVKINHETDNVEALSIIYLTEGDVFGEMSAIDNQLRSAFCIAKTDCSLLKISSFVVQALLAEDIQFNRLVIDLLIKRVRETDLKLFRVGSLSATQRIVVELIRLGSVVGKNQDCVEIGFCPTHKEIAHLAFTSRENTTRTLGQLEKQGLLERNENAFLIPSIINIKAF